MVKLELEAQRSPEELVETLRNIAHSIDHGYNNGSCPTWRVVDSETGESVACSTNFYNILAPLREAEEKKRQERQREIEENQRIEKLVKQRIQEKLQEVLGKVQALWCEALKDENLFKKE